MEEQRRVRGLESIQRVDDDDRHLNRFVAVERVDDAVDRLNGELAEMMCGVSNPAVRLTRVGYPRQLLLLRSARRSLEEECCRDRDGERTKVHAGRRAAGCGLWVLGCGLWVNNSPPSTLNPQPSTL